MGAPCLAFETWDTMIPSPGPCSSLHQGRRVPNAMLDVHVPHPTHTWKDFFIHVGTIVVGLLSSSGFPRLTLKHEGCVPVSPNP